MQVVETANPVLPLRSAGGLRLNRGWRMGSEMGPGAPNLLVFDLIEELAEGMLPRPNVLWFP